MTFEPGLICDRWKLVMPDFRVKFHADRPRWELGRLEHMAERVKPGMVVWDVGAEHGDLTALYASWGADVVPIEPAAHYWPCIRQTFEANGFGPPRAWFVGFAADKTYRPRDTSIRSDGVGFDCDCWPDASEGPVLEDPGFFHLAYHSRTFPCVTIDDLAGMAPAPQVLSVDVEGAEWHVLSGARDFLTAFPTLVYVSVHPPTMRNWYGRTPTDLHMLMSEYGYVARQLPHWGEAEEFWYWEKP